MRVPTCPKCGATYTLVLIDNQRVLCIREFGGCGQEFPIEVLTDFTDLFKEQKVGRG